MQLLIELLNQPARWGHNDLMQNPAHPNLSRRSLHWPLRAGVLTALLGLTLVVWADDETLDDLLKNAKPASTAPHETTGPQTTPGNGVVDALGTMKPRVPAGARIGLIELSTGTKYEGRVWTPGDLPLRVWVEELKTYRDIDVALIRKIDVKVLSATMEADWRWKKEGSDEKVYSGRKYPLVDLAYRFTLLNEQVIDGTIDAEVDSFDGDKLRRLALYKKYKGKLDETLADLVYIRTVTLRESDVVNAINDKKTTKLPLLD